MVRVIVKKEEKVKWLSLKMVRSFKRKGIRLYFFVLRMKLKGYDVEIIDERVVI